jgi:hypothetical protein
LQDRIPAGVITWGSDEGIFQRALSSQAQSQSLEEFRNILLKSRSSNVAVGSTPGSQPKPSVLIRDPALRKFQLAFNAENGFYLCENKGKFHGMCCTGLAVEEVWKHLTDTLVRAMSDRLPHGYKIRQADKANFERDLIKLHPNAALTREDLKAITPNPGQIGPVVGVRPPRDGFICKKCDVGYTTGGSAAFHWRSAHGKRKEDKPTKPDGTPGEFVRHGFRYVQQMQTLSLHSGSIRWFEIIPAPFKDQHICVASPGDLETLMDLQTEVFGQESELVPDEIDEAGANEFFMNSGASEHIQGYYPTELIALVQLPLDDEPHLVKLRRAQSLRYMSACKRISKGSIAVRRLLVTTLPYVHFML